MVNAIQSEPRQASSVLEAKTQVELKPPVRPRGTSLKRQGWKKCATAKSARAKQSKLANNSNPKPRTPHCHKRRVHTQPDSAKSKWDTQDRMFEQAEFSKLQRMIGLKFTMDACCNEDGSNALVPECFKSSKDSFLDYDCKGHTVWLNPPYADITPFLKHYSECKARSPHNTSAVIVLPKWKGSQYCHYLKGMQVIKEYPKGSRLFSGSPRNGSADREPLGPTPWPIQVYYDPPVAMPLACSAALDIEGATAAQELNYSQSELDCVHLQAKIAGANARCLVDSGANQSLLSARYCKVHGVVVTPAPRTVELADGKQMQVAGVCNVRLQIGQYKAVHKCWVAAMHPAYDLILGRTWMTLNKAIIDASCNKLSVVTSKGRVIISQSPVAAEPGAIRGQESLKIMTVLQAKRATRKNCSRVLLQ
jgi:16S rRNA G966 N2-methylase RsmD